MPSNAGPLFLGLTRRQYEIVSRRRECMAVGAIAAELGVSKQAVSATLAKLWPNHTEWVGEQMQARAESLREQFPSLSQAALKSKLLEGAGPKAGYRLTIPKSLPAYVYLRGEVLRLHGLGLTETQIGCRLGFTQSWVSDTLIKAGVRILPSRVRRGPHAS